MCSVSGLLSKRLVNTAYVFKDVKTPRIQAQVHLKEFPSTPPLSSPPKNTNGLGIFFSKFISRKIKASSPGEICIQQGRNRVNCDLKSLRLYKRERERAICTPKEQPRPSAHIYSPMCVCVLVDM